MKSLLFALLLSSLAIIGCSGGEADIQCCVIDLEDAMCNNNEYIKLSKYASSIDYVPLETSDECALGSIFTMNIDEKCIYLFEFSKSRNLVTVFDISAGELVKVFNKRGRGPDEYVSAHWLGLKPEKDGSSKFIIPWFKGIYVYNIESEIAVSKFGWKQKTNRNDRQQFRRLVHRHKSEISNSRLGRRRIKKYPLPLNLLRTRSINGTSSLCLIYETMRTRLQT